MSKKSPSLLTILSYLPWWVSVITGLTVYIGLAHIVPSIASGNQTMGLVAGAGQKVAIILSLLFIIPTVEAMLKGFRRKRLIEHQKSIETLRETSWGDFEVLVGEVFRRKGCAVKENMIGGPDGGIDLLLSKQGELHIVQCKQWRNTKVSVSIVREMFGVLKASSAKTVYIVSSGYFTKEAINFAKKLPITLINGHELLSLISEVQSLNKPIPVNPIEDNEKCPKCDADLVKRTAQRGQHKGNQFLGCSSFPKCRYIQT